MRSGSQNRALGTRAETLAVEFLCAHGYEIRTQNWNCRGGELDIVASQGDILVFVEVKARHSSEAGDALEAITPRKKDRLLVAIHEYLNEHRLEEALWRLDAIAVTFNGSSATIEHVEDVLGW